MQNNVNAMNLNLLVVVQAQVPSKVVPFAFALIVCTPERVTSDDWDS